VDDQSFPGEIKEKIRPPSPIYNPKEVKAWDKARQDCWRGVKAETNHKRTEFGEIPRGARNKEKA